MARTTLDHACGSKNPIRFLPTLAAAALAGAFPALAAAQDPKAPAAPEPVVELPFPGPRAYVPAAAPLPAKGDVPGPAPAAVPERVRVEYDDAGEHGLWARGATYKAGFSPGGALYAPDFGPRAPRAYPLALRLAHASAGGVALSFDEFAAPEREGDVVRFRRGGVTEVYELGLDSVEQIFVFDALPAAGELVLRVAVETELWGRETSERLEFSNEHGSVGYGRATAFDAGGASIAAPTTLTADGIEIRVPAEFVAGARFPLVIDPVITTFSVDSTTRDSRFPDVACSPGVTDYYLTVYEEIFSATDHDVRYRLLDEDGASVTTGYIDASLSQNWARPAVALTGDPVGPRFLVVAEVGFAPNRTIQGRILNRLGVVQGSAFAISSGDQTGDKLAPDVGGDPFSSGGAFFCVTWERVFSSSDRDIHYRLVTPQGTLQGTSTRLLDNTSGTVDSRPSISKSNDTGNWNVVWQRASTNVPVQQDIRAGRILWNGNVTAVSFAVDSSSVDTHSPSASTSLTDVETWMIAYQRDVGSDYDIGLVALNGPTVIDTANLTGLEVSALGLPTLLENQIRPDVDSDGDTFAIAYAESYQGSSVDYDVYVSTVALTGNRINLSEGHKNLAFSGTAEDYPSIASFNGAINANVPVRQYLAVWQDAVDPALHTNVEGGFYEASNYTSFCFPSQDGVAGCPCGNPPNSYGRGCRNSTGAGALLTAALTPSVNLSTMVLTASAMPATALSIFNQGDAAIDAGVVFGQGIRCVGGNLKRLYVKSAVGGTASAPQPGDPSVWSRSLGLGDPISAGTTRSYYVYYRDAVVLGGCPSSSTFNTTQAIQTLWVN